MAAALAPAGSDSRRGARCRSGPDGDETFAAADRSVAAAARAAGDPARPLGFLAADRPAAVPGLARKLPHYGKYGYLAFQGDAPDNVAKGSWRPVGSPLDRVLATEMSPPPAAAPLPERTAARRAAAGARGRMSRFRRAPDGGSS